MQRKFQCGAVQCAVLIALYAHWIRMLMGDTRESLLIPGEC